jgi:hypothetical protein
MLQFPKALGVFHLQFETLSLMYVSSENISSPFNIARVGIFGLEQGSITCLM